MYLFFWRRPFSGSFSSHFSGFLTDFNRRYWSKIMFMQFSKRQFVRTKKIQGSKRILQRKMELHASFLTKFCQTCVFLVFGASLLSRNHRNVNFKVTGVKHRRFLNDLFFPAFNCSFFSRPTVQDRTRFDYSNTRNLYFLFFINSICCGGPFTSCMLSGVIFGILRLILPFVGINYDSVRKITCG